MHEEHSLSFDHLPYAGANIYSILQELVLAAVLIDAQPTCKFFYNTQLLQLAIKHFIYHITASIKSLFLEVQSIRDITLVIYVYSTV